MSDLDSATTPAASARRVAYITRDLFFGVRLATGLAKLGFDATALTRQAELPENSWHLVVVDLSIPTNDVLPLIRAAAARAIPVLAFGSHMQQEVWLQAKQAGATRVVANSQLVEHLGDLVAKLAL